MWDQVEDENGNKLKMYDLAEDISFYNGEGTNSIRVDARDLFDKQFLKELIEGIFLRYYQGFVGREIAGEVPLDFDELETGDGVKKLIRHLI